MKRREFTHGLAGTALSTGVGLSWAQGRPRAGNDFQVLDVRAPVEAPAGTIEVVEFFWYNCPHCNEFEPALASWVKRLPKDVAFRRVHVAFQESFVPQQRLYFTLQTMGLEEKLHTKVFEAIHEKKVFLQTGETITKWLAQQGVDAKKFVEQYNSFTVISKAKRASQLQDAYKVEGVPALGVAGRYYTDGAMTGSMGRCLQVVDYLLADIRLGR